MSNHHFQFRQFTIAQDRCAMKVSTDACIQGAFTPVHDNVRRVLDIGTGTGLLSLMLAQRINDITIDALELDEVAAIQASENISAAPFANRITVVQGNINTYNPAVGYDLIICNPPFFTNSLLGSTASRNMARHTLTLTHAGLIAAIKRLLNSGGYASILLPFLQQQLWEELAGKSGLHIHRRLFIKPYQQHTANRVVSILGMGDATCTDSELVIYREQNKYTPATIELLSPFYAKEMQ